MGVRGFVVRHHDDGAQVSAGAAARRRDAHLLATLETMDEDTVEA
jgi:hypothetical protein